MGLRTDPSAALGLWQAVEQGLAVWPQRSSMLPAGIGQVAGVG
jgi:hypothetical protein